MTNKTTFLQFCCPFREINPDFFCPEYLSPLNTPAYYMMHVPGCIKSWLSWHSYLIIPFLSFCQGVLAINKKVRPPKRVSGLEGIYSLKKLAGRR